MFTVLGLAQLFIWRILSPVLMQFPSRCTEKNCRLPNRLSWVSSESGKLDYLNFCSAVPSYSYGAEAAAAVSTLFPGAECKSLAANLGESIRHPPVTCFNNYLRFHALKCEHKSAFRKIFDKIQPDILHCIVFTRLLWHSSRSSCLYQKLQGDDIMSINKQFLTSNETEDVIKCSRMCVGSAPATDSRNSSPLIITPTGPSWEQSETLMSGWLISAMSPSPGAGVVTRRPSNLEHSPCCHEYHSYCLVC